MSRKKGLPSQKCLLKEYELSQQMHNYYGRIVWEIGSIFVGGGLAMIGLIISRTSRPSSLPALAAITFTILMICFYLMIRRFRVIAEVHLRRCREIENELGLYQHRYVRLATYTEGIVIHDETVRDTQSIKIPSPTGWTTLQSLIIFLVIISWVIAIYFLYP